ncbi:MAG TPA: NIPSNAP family protein [Candidatus Dormibacteraeota bacterium]|nr:NIPSNAP family protein [Candidatus Dormibacteraeota bacterium]
MLFELRQYRVRPGCRDDLVRLMEEVVIPFQASKGMVVVGSFVAVDDPDLYVWIRRFEDEEERQRLYAAVYESERWKEEIAPLIGPLLDRERMVVTRLRPTSKSVVR